MQALYDDPDFFRSYLKLRQDENNFNDLFEQPNILSMLPDVTGKRILEIGAGYGATSKKFIQLGAAQVTALDVSQTMLRKAREENSDPKISYLCMDAADLSGLDGTWDIAFSSLVFHYLEDFPKLFRQIYSRLEEDGVLLFSMEHPIVTAAKEEARTLFGADGEPESFLLDHYSQPGRREVVWLGAQIVKYHHTLAEIMNALIGAGFTLKEVREPLPEESLRSRLPRMREEIHRPSYLMICARKIHS